MVNGEKFGRHPQYKEYKKIYERIVGQRLRGHDTFPQLLWSYVGHWMVKCRGGIFHDSFDVNTVPSRTVKELFNNVFAFAYSALDERYISWKTLPSHDQIVSRPDYQVDKIIS
ncbi:hypothetical protein PtA15_3A533 [Puccinia triticina]|nr:uncharacterized protein PtA15_3A533 [Puccinia triticina]WAQ83165.1 hypothetical protein PtA15_3A533 [Puccinia triticina]